MSQGDDLPHVIGAKPSSPGLRCLTFIAELGAILSLKGPGGQCGWELKLTCALDPGISWAFRMCGEG